MDQVKNGRLSIRYLNPMKRLGNPGGGRTDATWMCVLRYPCLSPAIVTLLNVHRGIATHVYAGHLHRLALFASCKCRNTQSDPTSRKVSLPSTVMAYDQALA
jgi:hypothetical protein